MSDLLCTWIDPMLMTRACMGSQTPRGCRATMASLLSASRKGCHCCGWIYFKVPFAECRSR